ncbi:MAG: enoyl-CoA hydratase/isomerase family protein [Dehalococcoidia bacterium]
MPDPLAVVSIEGRVGHLRLNRPDKRNALNVALSRAVTEGMERLDADPAVVVIVVEGTDGAFCAGADMEEALAAEEAGEINAGGAGRATSRVEASPKPLIAAIDGAAYGAGALLACACDIRIVTDRSRFRFPGAEYGLVVGAVALPRLVGPALAKELIFTSRVVEADEALRVGLANRVVTPDDLAETVEVMAQAIASASPEALRWSKATINAAVSGGDAAALERQADLLLRGGEDHVRRFTVATHRVTGRGAGGAGGNGGADGAAR